MAVKESDLGTAIFSGQPIVNLRMRIEEDTLGPGARTTLSVILKNVSEINLPDVQCELQLYEESPITIMPDRARVNLEAGETEQVSFLVDNWKNPKQASFKVGVILNDIPGGPFHSASMEIP